MSENAITEENQNSAPAKKKRSKEDILEIVIAVFLGITALATAWASWIGSLHGGNMSTNYTKSNNLAADGNARWNEASQSLMQDMQIWNTISDYEVEILYANETGDTDQMYESAYKIKFICTDNLTEKMTELIGYDFEFDADQIIDWVINSELSTTSPFANQDFIDSYYADAQAVLAERIAPLLTEEETAFYRRGKNSHTHAIPKNATPAQYAKATGLETLFGALFLLGRQARLEDLFTAATEEDYAL